MSYILLALAFALCTFVGFMYGAMWAVKTDARIERMRSIHREESR